VVDKRGIDEQNQMAEKDRYDHTFSWKIIDQEEGLNKIFLDFSKPEHISFDYPARLELEVCEVGSRICITDDMRMPKLLTKGEESVIDAVSSLSKGAQGQGVAVYFLGLFRGLALGSILNSVSNITIAVHMMIVHIYKPGIVVAIFEVILELVTFDILPMDTVYDLIWGESDELPNEDLTAAGYETNSSIRNMGSVFVFFWIVLFMLFQLWFLTKVVPDDQQENVRGWRQKYNHNQLFNLLWHNVIMIMCCVFVQHRYTENFKKFDVIMNVSQTFFIFLLIIAIPISITFVHCKRGWNRKGEEIKRELEAKDDEILQKVRDITNIEMKSLCAYGLFNNHEL